MNGLQNPADLPLVSIGVPTYNRPNLLEKVLSCLTAQTYQNLEILVSDNCSPDLAVEKIGKAYADKDQRITYIRQTENKGAEFNFKFVFEGSAGKYYMWLADDDIISERFIEEAVKFLEVNPDYSMASGIPFWMDHDITRIGPLPILSLESNSPRKRIFKYILTAEDNCVFYSLLRRSQLDAIYPLPTYAGNDWLMVIRLLYLGKSKILPDASVYKNIGGLSHDISAFARLYSCSAFWIKHRMITLYRHLLKDIFNSDYLGTTLFGKTVSFFAYSFACLFRGIGDFVYKWIYMIIYRGYIKQYFFHIFYLILPNKAFSTLKTIKQKTVSAVSQILKK